MVRGRRNIIELQKEQFFLAMLQVSNVLAIFKTVLSQLNARAFTNTNHVARTRLSTFFLIGTKFWSFGAKNWQVFILLNPIALGQRQKFPRYRISKCFLIDGKFLCQKLAGVCPAQPYSVDIQGFHIFFFIGTKFWCQNFVSVYPSTRNRDFHITQGVK